MFPTDRSVADTIAATVPSPSPDHDYAAGYEFTSVNRHWIDTCRLYFSSPDSRAIDRFITEGLLTREQADVIRKGYFLLGYGMVAGAALGSFTCVRLTRSVLAKGGPLAGWQTAFAILTGGLVGSQVARPIATFAAGETIYRETSKAGELALLSYRYASVVKDPLSLPPHGSSLFALNGRANFATRRPLAWQIPGVEGEMMEVKDPNWVQVKKVVGAGYGK